MANERDDEQINETGSESQNPPIGQGQQNPPTGQGQQNQPTDQSERQSEFGQESGQQPSSQNNEFGSQAQPSGGSDTLTTDESASGDQSGSSGSGSGEGFIGSQPSGSDEHVQEGGSTDVETGAADERASGGIDFAEKGQGAPAESEDDRNSTGSGNTGGGGGF